MPSVPTNHASSTISASPVGPRLLGPRLCCRVPSKTARRRPNQEQGRALEILGHAIEYLMDSELHRGDGVFSADLLGATDILMERSKTVFAECREIKPMRETLRQGLVRMFGRPTLMVRPTQSSGWQPDSLTR